MMLDLLLKNARVPACLTDASSGTDDLVDVDIAVSSGRIAAVAAPGENPDAKQVLDCARGIALPGFVDVHTHLDKGHIWPRTPNPDGTFMGALDAAGRDREASWSSSDIDARMDFSLRCAFAYGTVAIRTHLDSIGKQTAISWPVYAMMREKWRERITLQAAPLFPIQAALDPAHLKEVVDAVKVYGDGIFGAVTYMCPELDEGLDLMFRAAIDHGFDLDFHVDEASDPSARSLERIAAAALRHRFQGKVLCGHCCALALQAPEDEARIIGLVLEAGISVVSLPMCNMYLQDRIGGRTPRWRGITSLHELKAAGVPVMVASDNTRDPFYAYGDLDPVELLREATRICHFDHPVNEWPRAITRTPAGIMNLQERGVVSAGARADLILFKARNWTEMLSRPQSDRTVLRNGVAIDRRLPDYCELDHLAGMRP